MIPDGSGVPPKPCREPAPMQYQMVDIQAQEGQSAQDVNGGPAAVQGQEGMEVKNQWKHSQSAQSAKRA